MKSITLNGVEYVEKTEVTKAMKKANIKPSAIQIVVLQRGWVYIGRFSQKGNLCTLTNAYNIRRWGTEYGLGELAENGPIAEGVGNGPTKLDKNSDVHFHEMTAVLRMDVDESKWSSIID
jgi:hypothetical protein